MSGIISAEEASGEIQGSLLNGKPPCGKEVIALRSKHQKRKKVANKKQRREYLPGIHHVAAALYWFARLASCYGTGSRAKLSEKFCFSGVQLTSFASPALYFTTHINSHTNS